MKTKELIKNTEATFTPKGLANYLSGRILSYVDKKVVTVLDPSCGDGELLISIGDQMIKRGIDYALKGYDLNEEYLALANKPTADKVFISDEWDKLGDEKPEDDLLKDLISQENIDRWENRAKVTLQILYPHYSKNGNKRTIDIEEFPKARMYFERNEERLKGRKYLIDAGRKWFEIWVAHHPDYWKLPKLVFPQLNYLIVKKEKEAVS